MNNKIVLQMITAAAVALSSVQVCAEETIIPEGNSMRIYDVKTEAMTCPLGIDTQAPMFSWKLGSERRGAAQESYRIKVAGDSGMNNVVYDSGTVHSDISNAVSYCGKPLDARTRYYWTVTAADELGNEYTSAPQWFETGLMGSDASVWNGAQWIRSPYEATNTDALNTYSISADFRIISGAKAGIVTAARNKDNYVLIETDMESRLIKAYEYCDEAWSDGIPKINPLGNAAGYAIPETAVKEDNSITIRVNNRNVTVELNGETVIENAENMIPKVGSTLPQRQYMMMFGLKQDEGCVRYDNITVTNTKNGTEYRSDDFSDDNGVLSALGTVSDGGLIVENEFNLVNAVPSVNVRRLFNAEKEISSARLYASARGFYDAYINGEKVNNDFYNPGFTDYRKRIFYQTYDVTDMLKTGVNSIGATVAKGYYSGFVGYQTNPMVYGAENSFIGQLVIDYTDGSQEVIVTDDSWQFTDKAPVQNADYLQGECYDARLEFDWNDTADGRWGACGIKAWPEKAVPSNGKLNDERFELCAQAGPGAGIERVLTPVGKPVEAPEGHFVYDLGQNIAGTVRIRFKGERGTSIKLRYSEMCYKEGNVYLASLRSAANTDTYTLSGASGGETFIPSFTSHGFRYIEISGNGCDLTAEQLDTLVIGVEGLVLTNTAEETGSFECSNEDITKLQSNIEWGQRGNSLLIYTDCPQRNERMGWTGDAQVFAPTAAYNMDIKAFMNKWLMDLRDSQLMYNLDGAVPDTAPLGGDNRKKYGGCDGWGDAAVIVPWELYKAYGDVKILEDNYEMMKKWVDYQSRDDRQTNGIRTINGTEVPDRSDLSSEPYLQIQQEIGDHLSYDYTTPIMLSATAYAAHSAELLAKTAEVLGNAEDAAKYYKRFEDVKKAFNEAWVKEDGSIGYWGEMSLSSGTKTTWGEKGIDRYGNSINEIYYSDAEGSINHPSQTAYALAIDFGLIPQEKMARASACFKRTIDERDGKLSVGFLGISHLAPALTKAGLDDYAFALLEQTESPGWLYSVRNDATTIWERWNSYDAETGKFGNVNMNSFNHYSYGAIGEWMYGEILGINTSEAAGETGYKKIILTPTAGGGLTYAKGSYNSAYGEIKSEWHIDGDSFLYECTVPANTTAVLYLPSNGGAVYESGMNAEAAEGVVCKGTVNGRAVFELASGSYSFRSDVAGLIEILSGEKTAVSIADPDGINAAAIIGGKEYSLPLTDEEIAVEYLDDILIVSRDPSYEFAYWSGDIVSCNNPIVTSVPQNAELAAHFKYIGGEGGDTVTLNIDGTDGAVIINGEKRELPYRGSFSKGTELVLLPDAPDDMVFDGWSNEKLIGDPAVIVLNEDMTTAMLFNISKRKELVSTGKKASSNNSYEKPKDGWSVSKLTDGVTTGTGYTSEKFSGVDAGSNPPYFEIDLGAEYAINRTVLYPRTDDGAIEEGYSQFPQDFKVQAKGESGEYITVTTVTGAPDTAEPYIIDFNTVNARYIKVTATKLSPNQISKGGIRFQLAECEIYADGSRTVCVNGIELSGDETSLKAAVSPENADNRDVLWFALAPGGGLSRDIELSVTGNEVKLIPVTEKAEARIIACAADQSGTYAVYDAVIDKTPRLEASKEIRDGIMKISVVPINCENGVIIAAEYKDNILMGTTTADYTGSEVIINAEYDDEPDRIEIMLWNSLEEMTPLCGRLTL